ncbi:MAG TPA: DUF4276 family protein [Phycisphaerae bacterium]|nr:DUF4276 family protein [Phycisphaerae bacterium]HRR85624.1 DUF4276 family protein [Phycisphaerae bacterium]
MSRLRVAPIVEGYGEFQAIRPLFMRLWTEQLGGEYIDVLQPIRRPRSQLGTQEGLSRAISLAVLKLTTGQPSPDPCLILVLLDRDPDPKPPCELGPKLLESGLAARPDFDITYVLANIEYETWFVAAAESLRDYIEMPPDEPVPSSPEDARHGKSWIQRHFKGIKYSETVDQPAMTSKMDLALCRRRSPSFDKLCRELEKRLKSG